jgi:hypothetical protein
MEPGWNLLYIIKRGKGPPACVYRSSKVGASSLTRRCAAVMEGGGYLSVVGSFVNVDPYIRLWSFLLCVYSPRVDDCDVRCPCSRREFPSHLHRVCQLEYTSFLSHRLCVFFFLV